MATYPNALKCNRMDEITAYAGTTAVLEIGTTGMGTVLATIPLGNPIAGAATGAGVLTLSGFPRSDTSADATGTAAAARIRTASGGSDVVTGITVGTSGAELILATTSIVAATTVTVNSATLTHFT